MTNPRKADAGRSDSKKSRQSLPIGKLKEYLRYEPEEGRFYWRKRPSNRVYVGSMAGNDHRGYRRIRILGHLFPEHELVWFFERGRWPVYEIDHINGDGSDNRIKNLRDVPHAVNGQNQRRARTDNKVGKLGVFKNKRTGSYVAKIMLDGKSKHIGSYPTADQAHKAYLKAKRKIHEGCTI